MPRKTKPKVKNKQSLPSTPKKKPVKKKPVSRVEKPYNCNTMSSAAFWGMIKSALRGKSRYWKPSAKVKLAARRDYKGGTNPRQKYEYKCAYCGLYYPEKSIQVDHITPVGSLNCAADLAEVVERLFCPEEGLQVLCSNCHQIKSLDDLVQIKEIKRLKAESKI